MLRVLSHSLSLFVALAFLPALSSCGEGSPDVQKVLLTCERDAQCDDGLYCNGVEVCDDKEGRCKDGLAVDCNDELSCTIDSCNEDLRSCTFDAQGDQCESGAGGGGGVPSTGGGGLGGSGATGGATGGSGGNPGCPGDYPCPLGYWPLDSADLSGLSTALDRGTGAVNGTVIGGNVSTGQVGEGMGLFGGALDFGDSYDSTFAGAGQKFSFSIWLRPAKLSGDWVVAGKLTRPSQGCTPDAHDGPWQLWLPIGGKLHLAFYGGNNAGNVAELSTSSAVIDENVWNHVLFTYDGAGANPSDRVKMYVDGVAAPLGLEGIANYPWDIGDSAAHFGIGTSVDPLGDRCGVGYQGLVDEIALWNSALTAGQAQAIYNQGKAAARLVP